MEKSNNIETEFHKIKYKRLFPCTIFLAILTALCVANINMFTNNKFISGDMALDILLIEQGRDRWLLTGHHTSEYFRFDAKYGLYHLGPFFLDVRLVGEVLFENLTGSRFGGQLIGVLFCATMFSCLLASLILRLLLREGAKYKIAASAAIVATILVVIEISATQSLTTMWGPQLVVLPFVTFMVAALATCRGDAFGLLACSFSAATLVHGYIPTIPATAPVWMIAVVLGQRARHRETGRGFPLATWVGVAAISAVFALPLIVDMIVHPPGNVVRVILAGFDPPVGAPHPTIRQVAGFYFRQLKSVAGWWWLVALAGAVATYRLGTCRRLYIDGGILVLAAAAGSFIFFVQATAPLGSFMFLYLLGVFLVFPLIGFVTVMVASTVCEKAANAMVVAALAVLAVKSVDGSMESFAPSFRDGPELVGAIADDFPPLGEAAFTVKDTKLFTPTLAFTAGMMVALSTEDRQSCITNPEYGFIVTPGRICGAVPAAEGRRRYTVERQPGGPCVTEGLSGDLDTALLYKRDSLCLVIRRTDG